MTQHSKILLAGGSGFVGSAIRQMLEDSNMPYHVLTTSKKKAEKDSFYYWNPKKGEMDANALQGVDRVINLSGTSIAGSWSDDGKKKILESRLKSTEYLANALKNLPNQVQTVVNASAIGYYADTSDRVDETSEVGQGFLAETCAAWEKATEAYPDHINLYIARIGLVVDVKAELMSKLKLPALLGVTSIPGSAKTPVSWIHVDDLARLLLFLATGTVEAGVYNAVSPGTVPAGEFYKAIGGAFRKQWISVSAPSFMLKLLMGEKSAIALDAHNVSADKIEDAGFDFKIPDVQELQRKLKYDRSN